ncbi:MAG: MCE family protein, partial [Phormidesmis sp. CAN_BIN44]|nr:MCE family protein [Phormidesmis sp. CAN_BIN44]
ATFQNAQKITADLDELTGDPQLRNDLRNLIKGLSGLTSSTQQLQQQAQVAQVLAPYAETSPQSTTTLEATEPLFGITRSPSSLAPAPISP